MNLKEAADTLGVHYQTAYRWVRDGELIAGKIQGSYEVKAGEVERFLALRLAPAAPPISLRVRDWAAQLTRFEAALRDGNELGARAMIDRLSDGNVPLIDLCEKLFAPCMQNIGEQWHNGTVSVAQEHRATAILERMLGRLAIQPRGRPRGTAVVSTPPGELHGLPSVMAALVLREDRWKVHHLGADTPFEDLAKFSVDVHADLVVLSSTLTSPNEWSTSFGETLASFGIRLLAGRPGSTLRTLLMLAMSSEKALEQHQL